MGLLNDILTASNGETIEDGSELVVVSRTEDGRARIVRASLSTIATIINDGGGGGGSGDVQMVFYPVGGPWPARPDDAVHVIWVTRDPDAGDPAGISADEDLIIAPEIEYIIVPFSDYATSVIAATSLGGYAVPQDATLYTVFLDFVIAGPTTNPAIVDVNINGVSALTTKLRVDAGETSSRTASVAAVIGVSALDAGDIITIDVDSIGTGAKGGQVTLGVYR
jgi:hypothetical protein